MFVDSFVGAMAVFMRALFEFPALQQGDGRARARFKRQRRERNFNR